MKILRIVLRILLVVAIIAAGFYVTKMLILKKTQAEKQAYKPKPPLVEFIEVSLQKQEVTVEASGIVVPAREVTLKPEVGGVIVAQSDNLVPGGQVTEGELLIKIDPSDYELAVKQKEASLVQAQYELDVEKGRQAVARRDYKLFESEAGKDEAGTDLILRKPHLRFAQSKVDSAESSLKMSELDVQKTQLFAPFNAIVRDESVEVGQLVSSQTSLATLVGTDTYWVQVSIPVDRLAWISIPDINSAAGSEVRVIQDTGNGTVIKRRGNIARLLSDLDPVGRLARVLVEIDDPLGLKSGRVNNLPMLLGAYVQVEINGRELEKVIEIPRIALREGDKVWTIDSDNKLGIRNVNIAWSRKDTVLVKEGLSDGDRIIVSPLGIPIEGMELRTEKLESSDDNENKSKEELAAGVGNSEDE